MIIEENKKDNKKEKTLSDSTKIKEETIEKSNSKKEKDVYYITTEFMTNVRKNPSLNSEIVHVLNFNDKVKIIDKLNSDFIHVKTDTGIEGYVKSNLLTISN